MRNATNTQETESVRMSDEQEVANVKEQAAEMGASVDGLSYDDLLSMGRRWRDREFADMISGIVAIVAETNPDILRTALGKVFDTAAIEDTTKRLMLLVNQAAEDAREAHRIAREGAHENRKLLEQIHGEIDGLRSRVQKAQAFMDNLAKRVANAEKHLANKPKIFNK